MSLINQALRKAQQERSPKRMAQPGENPQHGMPAGPSGGSGLPLGLIIGVVAFCAVLIGAVVALVIVLLAKDSPAEVAAAPTPAAVTAPVQSAPAPATQPAPAPITQRTTTTTQTSESQLSVLEELRLAREAAEIKAAEEAAAAEKAARAAAAEPNQAIIDWLSEAKVTGVRMSGDDSKAVINNKAYETGELVHYGLGLKLIVIQETRLLFEDANSKRYMKRL